MGKQHLDLLPLASRGDVGIGGGDVARYVAGALGDRAQKVAGRFFRTAARLQGAGFAVALARPVAHEAFTIDAVAWHREGAAELPKFLTARADVEIATMIIGEVGPAEGAVPTRSAIGVGRDRLAPTAKPSLPTSPSVLQRRTVVSKT